MNGKPFLLFSYISLWPPCSYTGCAVPSETKSLNFLANNKFKQQKKPTTPAGAHYTATQSCISKFTTFRFAIVANSIAAY